MVVVYYTCGTKVRPCHARTRARRRGRWRGRAGRPVLVRLATAVPAALVSAAVLRGASGCTRPARITLLFHLDLWMEQKPLCWSPALGAPLAAPWWGGAGGGALGAVPLADGVPWLGTCAPDLLHCLLDEDLQVGG